MSLRNGEISTAPAIRAMSKLPDHKPELRDTTPADLANLRDMLPPIVDRTQEVIDLERKRGRTARFAFLKKGAPPDSDQAKIIDKKETLEDLKASDLLFLKKKGVDLANLLLMPVDKDPTKSTNQSLIESKKQTSFIINFGESKTINHIIGAGDILPPTVAKISINGVEGERRNIPRPGYYDAQGKYLPIFDGDKMEIITVGAIDKEKIKESDAASEKQWKRLRLADMIENNNDKPLTDLDEDKKLVSELQEYKEKMKMTASVDVVKITAFRISDAEFSNIANLTGLSSENIPELKRIMGSIGQHESNSNYGSRGQILPGGDHAGDAAIGRYQIMPKNWAAWSIRYFGEVLPVTPENQDRIAFAQMSTYFSKYQKRSNNPETTFLEIAGDWYGRGSPQIAGHPSTGGYQKSVLAIYHSLQKSTIIA